MAITATVSAPHEAIYSKSRSMRILAVTLGVFAYLPATSRFVAWGVGLAVNACSHGAGTISHWMDNGPKECEHLRADDRLTANFCVRGDWK